jgi:hypothetical protein
LPSPSLKIRRCRELERTENCELYLSRKKRPDPQRPNPVLARPDPGKEEEPQSRELVKNVFARVDFWTRKHKAVRNVPQRGFAVLAMEALTVVVGNDSKQRFSNLAESDVRTSWAEKKKVRCLCHNVSRRPSRRVLAMYIPC